LPDCPAKQLQLDLPEHLAPRLDHGVVVSVTEIGEGRRRWRIDLGGQSRLTLRLRGAAAEAPARRLTILRQTRTYDFSPRGVELSAQLTLDVRREPLRNIALEADRELRLVSAKYGDTEISWTVARNETTGKTDIELQLPEPIQGASRVVRLLAVAPLRMDEAWKLPTLEPQGVFWSEGSTRLLVPAPLALKELTLDNCRQTKVEPLPAPRAGELISLQQFAPEAAVQVVLGRQAGKVLLRRGTTVELSAGELTGRVAASFSIENAGRYMLTAEVAPQWILDTVETSPAGQLNDWTVERVGNRRLLNIRLARPLAPKTPLRLTITGRARRSALERPVSAAECRLLEFLDVDARRDLMLARPTPPFQLRFQGDDLLDRLDATELSAAYRALLDTPDDGVAFE
jgi:hypothetical protein